MWRILISLVVVGITGWSIPAWGHGKATERYIPLGRSVDSGKNTVLGTLQAVNAQAKTLHIQHDGILYTVTVTNNTKIWLDRSRLGVTNLEVGLDRVKPGPRAEVRCAENRCGVNVVAEWLKVEVTQK